MELKTKLDDDENFILLDVRTPEEVLVEPFNDRRVVNIPVQELREKYAELPKDKEIIIFCRTSVRAYEAERILAGKGFNDVKFLDGSLNTWPYCI
jgi:rhodanese-related sulfurtransferase